MKKKVVENLMVIEQREITPMKSENNLRTKIELFPFSLIFFFTHHHLVLLTTIDQRTLGPMTQKKFWSLEFNQIA